MEKSKRYLSCILSLATIPLNCIVNAGNVTSTESPKHTGTVSAPLSPHIGSTVINLDVGDLTVPVDSRSLIEHYSKRKDKKVSLSNNVHKLIKSTVANFAVTILSMDQLYVDVCTSYPMSISRDDDYKTVLQRFTLFFKNLTVSDSIPVPSKRASLRQPTTFRFPGFMSAIFRIMNRDDMSNEQKLKAFQLILTELQLQKKPIRIFSTEKTNTILSLDPSQVKEVTTVLIPEGSSLVNNVLLPGTLAILLKFYDINPKTQQRENELSLLYFVR